MLLVCVGKAEVGEVGSWVVMMLFSCCLWRRGKLSTLSVCFDPISLRLHVILGFVFPLDYSHSS